MGKYLLEGIKPLADAVSLGISIDTILVREGSSFPLEKVTPEIVLELEHSSLTVLRTRSILRESLL